MPADLLAERLPAPRHLLGMTEFTGEQRAAIERREAATLLDAGAGSGKTSVLVERFVRAVLEDGVAPDRILAITFTTKAAAELRERVRRRLHEVGAEAEARSTEEGWISTIDAFCARVLRADPLAVGLDPRFTVLQEEAADRLRQEAFEAALAELASTPEGRELLAAVSAGELRAAVRRAHDDLRAQGHRWPTLRPEEDATDDPGAGHELRVTADALLAAAGVAARELGLVPNPGVSIQNALATLERVPGQVGRLDLWPGALEALRLRNGGAAALKTEVCAAYGEALDALKNRLSAQIAVRQLDVLDRLLRAYAAAFAARKHQLGAVDFADLELLARDLLRRPDPGDRYRERFAHVMVDELQDSSAVQLELVDLLCAGGAVPFMVGDAQQSIYGFRHAHVEGFEARGAALEPAGGRLSLQTNFRTRAEILGVINAGFASALGDRFRPLRPGRSDPPGGGEPLVELLCVDKGADWEDDTALAAPWRAVEARVLAARVAELLSEGACRASDVVVLTRATTDLRVYERALEALGIATFVVGGRGYWRQPQVLELAAYLRALANPLDQEPLFTVLISPLCGLSLDALVLHAAGEREGWDPDDARRLAQFEAWLATERREAATLGPEELLERVIARTGYDRSIVAQPGGIRALANVRKLLRLAREHEAEHGPDLFSFAELVTRRAEGNVPSAAREAEAPVESEALDAVRLMTIHRSKGLEFPVVCVADLGRAPRVNTPLIRLGSEHRIGIRIARAGEGSRVNALAYDALKTEQDRADLEEAKRLFYVAMTRAKERLILSGAAKLEKPSTGDSVPMEWIARHFRELPGVRYTPVGERAVLESASLGDFRVQLGIDEAPPEPAAAPEPVQPALPPRPPVETLSYSGLVAYRRCGLRFKAERLLGLRPIPIPIPINGESAGSGGSGGRERGIALHETLRTLDLSRPGPPELEPVLASPTFHRLRTATRLRREQAFAFTAGGTLVTGAFDALATEGAGLLVVDYKSDRLNGSEPERLVEQRYALQRLIYAIAALRTGSERVEVQHLFLEAPEAPATAIYTHADLIGLQVRLDEVTAPLLAGSFSPAEEPQASLCAGCPAAGGLCPHPLALTRRSHPNRLF